MFSVWDSHGLNYLIYSVRPLPPTNVTLWFHFCHQKKKILLILLCCAIANMWDKYLANYTRILFVSYCILRLRDAKMAQMMPQYSVYSHCHTLFVLRRRLQGFGYGALQNVLAQIGCVFRTYCTRSSRHRQDWQKKSLRYPTKCQHADLDKLVQFY